MKYRALPLAFLLHTNNAFIELVCPYFLLRPSGVKDCSLVNSRLGLAACSAKPSLKSQFDLEKVEAFERLLDAERGAVGDDEIKDEEDVDEEISFSNSFITIPSDLEDSRLDSALAALKPKYSRSLIGNLIKGGHVFMKTGEKSAKSITTKSFKVEEGQKFQVTNQLNDKPTEIIPENIPLDILYEDEHMIVLNKAASMVVHPAAGNWNGTVVNALAYYLQSVSTCGPGEFLGTTALENSNVYYDSTEDGEKAFFRPGIVHRLDKGTTGVLVVAKTKDALAALSASFSGRRVRKTYLAITLGNPGNGVIDKPIGRHPLHRQKMRVVPIPSRVKDEPTDLKSGSPLQNGKRAITFVDTKAFDGKLSVVEVRIVTGRTHQIRVHLEDRHTPICGDDVYGVTDWNKRLRKQYCICRPLLHAFMLELEHPFTGERMRFQAPLANDMAKFVKVIWPESKRENPEMFRPISTGRTINVRR